MNWFDALINKTRNGSSSHSSDMLSPGLYHYNRQEWGERSQIHLRIDPDCNALLFVNANRIMHLNPSAALMARLTLENLSEPDSIRAIKSKFQVSHQQASNDYAQFKSRLGELLKPEGPCPIHDLQLEVHDHVQAT